MALKSIKRRVLAMAFAASIVFCLAGCIKADPTFLNEKVTAMIDLSVEHDTETRYSMLYPGVSDLDTYQSAIEMIDAYFPVTAGYTWELEQWKVTKGINNSSEIYDGQYKVEFDGKAFYIIAIWRSDSGGDGFTTFHILNEEDWITVQNK